MRQPRERWCQPLGSKGRGRGGGRQTKEVMMRNMSLKASGCWQRKTQATPPQGSCWASWQYDSGPDPATCGQWRTFPTGAGLHFLPRADSWQDFRTSDMPAKRKEELSWPCRGGKPSGRQPGPALGQPPCHGDQGGSGLLGSTQWVWPQSLVTAAGVPRSPGEQCGVGTVFFNPPRISPFTGQQTETYRRRQQQQQRFKRWYPRSRPPQASLVTQW